MKFPVFSVISHADKTDKPEVSMSDDETLISPHKDGTPDSRQSDNLKTTLLNKLLFR